MSIVIENNAGWFIDIPNYFNKIFENSLDNENQQQKFELRKELFQIKTPFVMKSNAVRIAENKLNKKTLKKRSIQLKKNEASQKSIKSNSSVEKIIEVGSNNIIQAARNLNYLEDPLISSEEWFQNNCVAQEAARKVPNIGDELGSLSFHNESINSTVMKFVGESYLLPPKSTFHLCDIQNIYNLKGEKYDLILLDPPWQNKSVRRKKGYTTLSCESLTDLPIEALSLPRAVVVVWVTNNAKQIAFIKEKLFPKWGISSSVMWHWMKVTQKGHLIHPIEWHHKKPYENLILGYVDHVSEDRNKSCLLNLTPNKVIVSVPSSIHSQKPPLVEILKPYLPEQPKCLELFARYLLPNWTSVGNEVLKLQNTALYEEVTSPGKEGT